MKIFILLILSLHVRAQINVNIQIVNGTQTLDDAILDQQLLLQNLTTGDVVSSGFAEQIVVQQCGTGTYSDGGDSQCFNCPAGTASPAIAATSATTCQTCFAGSFALTKASVCTQCSPNTFSTTVGAVDATVCTACPVNSASASGSDSVLDCTCNERFFSPQNVLTVIDPPAPVQFSSWQALVTGTSLLDVPHLVC
jgi:hypothetical protein